MNPSYHEMSPLKELLINHEDWLMQRLLHYAKRVIDIGDGASVEEAWRRCVRGLSGALIKGLETKYPDFEFKQGDDFRHDPLCSFMVKTAIRHRARGIGLEMFHGLMIYYKQAWLDLVRHGSFESEYETVCLKYVTRMFDRMMVAFCAEWADTDQSVLIEELQVRNRAMSREKDRYLTIFEGVPNPVFIIDEQNRIADLNLAASVMLDAPGTQGAQYYLKTVTLASDSSSNKETAEKNGEIFIGEPIFKIFPWLVHDLEKFIAGSTAFFSFEKEVRNGDESRYFGINLSRIKDLREIFSGFIIILEDITAQKQAAEELRTAKEAAEAASRAKSQFLSSMSHELRTPLNAMLGYSQILQKQKNMTEVQKEQLDIIDSSGRHLMALIDDLLDVGKIELGKVDIVETSLHLPNLISEVYNITKIKADEKSLMLRYEEIGPLPVIVKGDEKRLRQVMLNLLDNALKYTNRGSVTFRVGYPGEDSNTFRCDIEDQGVGIPENKMEEIFAPFVQLGEDSVTREGTGLGLAITRHLIELMKGNLSIKSEVGAGSLFSFQVELPVSGMTDISTEETKQIVIGYKGEQKKILAVDDNAANLSMLVDMLSALGFQVFTASSGRETVRNVTIFKPDLIILDMIMPDMDGSETLQKIKATQAHQQVKTIGFSAAVKDDARRRIFESLCDEFIPKPVSEPLLLEKIKKQIELEWLYDEVGTREAGASFSTETAKSEPIPAPQVLDEIMDLTEAGYFGELRKKLDDLVEESATYRQFCHAIGQYCQQYDSKGILSYLQQVMR